MDHSIRGHLDAFLQGKISRRDFITRALALGLSTPAVTAILASCAQPSEPATGAEPAAEPKEEADEVPKEPQIGGTLRMWFPPPQHDLSFFIYNSRRKAIPFKLIYNQLFRWNNTLSEIVPDFATSWEWNEERTKVTFQLRENAKFHDGEPATAEDVEFSYTIVANPATGSRWVTPLEPIVGAKEYSAGDADSITGIEVIDETTISFEFTGPAPGVWNAVMSQIPIVPKHILQDVPPETMPEHEQIVGLAIGTGPFRLIDYREGEFREFEAFEDYFLGRPRLDKILQILVDSSVIAPSLEAAEMDIGGPLTPYLAVEDVGRMDANPGLKRFTGPSNIVNQFGFNNETVPLRIRQACIMAVDRETIVRDALASLYQPYHSLFTHSWLREGNDTFGSIADLKTYPYDPDQARALVQEAIDAGEWEAGRTLKWLSSEAEPGPVPILLQSMLQDVGIPSEFSVAVGPDYRQKLYEEYDFDIRGPGGSSGGFDPDFLFINFGCYQYWNHSQYCKEEVDELFAQGRTFWEQDERRPIYLDIARHINEDLPRATLWLRINLWYLENGIHATPADYGENVTYDYVHEWWMES
ncbi:ABC transporter substrate-binding protein [Chloroflexi bacterium TSY]|nr:ABC transporter substrate-binding protein [Chloroflexi bacterium TSY]